MDQRDVRVMWIADGPDRVELVIGANAVGDVEHNAARGEWGAFTYSKFGGERVQAWFSSESHARCALLATLADRYRAIADALMTERDTNG